MQLAIPVEAIPVEGSDNVNDGLPEYDRFNANALYTPTEPACFWQSGDYEYQYIGIELTPIVWNVLDEANYAVDDVVFKDGSTYKVTDLTGTSVEVVSQPEQYLPAQSEEFDMASQDYWHLIDNTPHLNTNTYDGFTTVVNGITHTLEYDGDWGRWLYSISFPYFGEMWTAYKYYYSTSAYVSKYYYDYDSANGLVYATYSTTVKGVTYNNPAPVPEVTTFIGDDGKSYKVGRKIATHSTIPTRARYEIAKYELFLDTAEISEFVYMKTSITGDETLNSYCLDPDGTCGEIWMPRTLCFRLNTAGNAGQVSVFTGLGTKQTYTAAQPTYEEIVDFATFPNVSLLGVIDRLKPFDGKNYTFVKQESPLPIEYTVQPTEGSGRFNTVAFGGIIASEINGVFKNSAGVQVATGVMQPQTYRDEDGLLPKYPTTAIMYALDTNGDLVTLEEDGYVELQIGKTVWDDAFVQVGTIMLGLNVDAGFTNLAFTNKFNDWSPREVDQWGNVTYIEGVKTNVFNGTVDIRISNYDMINRLMISIGGSTVILNGSDALGNEVPSSDAGIFASTMLIGRMKDFQLKTKISDNDLDVMATYSFTLEENT